MFKKSLVPDFTGATLADGSAPVLIRHQMGKHGLNESDIGQMIDGKGVLLAPRFQHRTGHGLMIGPEFNVFAAPKDMGLCDGTQKGELLIYRDEIHRIANISDLLGHSGILINNDTELYQIVGTEPERLSSWSMPPLSLVSGNYIPGHGSMHHNPNNMYAHRNKGYFARTFSTKGYGSEERPDWYRSLTHSTHNKSIVWRVRFLDCDESWDYQDNEKIAVSTRAVRYEVC